MNPRALTVLLLAGTLLNACDSAGTEDALVGSWIRMRDTTEMRDRYLFGTDGSFAFDENKPDARETEDHMRGTYDASNGVVTATATNVLTLGQARLTFSYYAGATQFSSAALRASTGHAGILGAWTGIRKIERLDDSAPTSTGGQMEGEFRADGSFRWTVTPFDGTGPAVTEGTWVGEAGETFRANLGSYDMVFNLLDNDTLVDAPRIWQRN